MKREQNTRALAAALLAAAVCAGVPATAHADRYKDCGVQEQKNLKKVVAFISRNMSNIVDQYTFLSEKQRQEIVRKWPNVKIKCNDDSRMCRAKDGISVNGHAHGSLGNTINVCHANMVDKESTVCGAVGTVMHEMGHAHGFRKASGHNHPTPYIQNHDIIYRMGNLAAAYCSTTAATSDTFEGTKRAPLAAGCRNNSDCSSGRCWVSIDSTPFEVVPPGQDRGTCVCNDDGDCPGGDKCYKPLGKKHYCSATTKKLKESCNKNSQCSSDKCEGGECVCRRDTDCPGGPSAKCRTPITGKNYCE
jgi:hypothetical protein